MAAQQAVHQATGVGHRVRFLAASALTTIAAVWLVAGGRWAAMTTWALVGLAGIGLAYGHLMPRRFIAPLRRASWRRHARGHWSEIAEWCGLSERVPVLVAEGDGRRVEWLPVSPRLRKVQAFGNVLRLTIAARPGQTREDLEDAAPRLASTLDAVTFRTRQISGAASSSTAVIELVMADVLTSERTATAPAAPGAIAEVDLGRTQGGQRWTLPLQGRHTLIAGCSGAGKGSVLWGICCGLAPAVRRDVARLWGIDLKRGVELEMGAGLFSARAYTPTAALEVLRKLLHVIDQRGSAMAGNSRLHQPQPGDPLHVLVVDELAALTAYGDSATRREGERLLSEILTQGRALGVVVIACVQDPRKDVVAMRGLFTQTVALRLRSSDETGMVLGDGVARRAPAHRISPGVAGTAWIVEDSGSADRVRADYWPDELIREVSSRFATRVHVDLTPRSDSADPAVGGRRSRGGVRAVEGGAT